MTNDERCPTCGSEPDDDTLHRSECPRIGTCGQFGPPWFDAPWHPYRKLSPTGYRQDCSHKHSHIED